MTTIDQHARRALCSTFRICPLSTPTRNPVADCFRFRNTVGMDVALEALTEAWRSKRLNLDELNRIAKRLRVRRVMQPSLETVVL